MSPHARETRPFASEIKFVIAAALGGRIRDWARANLEPDPYGAGPFKDQYHTASLYLDTTAGDVFHRRGSFGRSKYRVRRYGEASFVFLERKLRKPGILVKRRTIVSLDSIDRLSEPLTDLNSRESGFTGGCCSARSSLWRSSRQPCRPLRSNRRRLSAADAGPGSSRRLSQRSAILGDRRADRASGQMILELKCPAAPAGNLQAPGRGIRARAATDFEVPSRDGADRARRVRAGIDCSGQRIACLTRSHRFSISTAAR